MMEPQQQQVSRGTSEPPEGSKDDLEYPKGYRPKQIVPQETTRSEQFEEELTTRSQRTSDFISRAVVVTLLGIMTLAVVAIFEVIIFPFGKGNADLTIFVGIFGSASATLLAFLAPSPLDTLSRTVSSIIRYWRERRDTDVERVKQAEERAEMAEKDRRIAEQALQEEHIKGIRLAENLMGRMHEAEADSKSTIGIDDLIRIVEGIYPEVKPPEQPAEQKTKGS